MAPDLSGKRVAILAADGVERVELGQPRCALYGAGAGTELLSTVNPDKLRINPDAVTFVRAFGGTGRPIAAICHGPWTLITGGRLTSWPNLRDDQRNAGAEPVDEQVVVDGQFTTSRSPADLPAFCPAIVGQNAGDRVPG